MYLDKTITVLIALTLTQSCLSRKDNNLPTVDPGEKSFFPIFFEKLTKPVSDCFFA